MICFNYWFSLIVGAWLIYTGQVLIGGMLFVCAILWLIYYEIAAWRKELKETLGCISYHLDLLLMELKQQ